MSPTLRYVLIGLGALVVLLVGAVFLIPVDVYRGQIEQAAQSATGRKLTIGGDLGLTVYPTLGIKAGNVTFANAPGGKAEQMAAIESLVVGVELIPLLSGDLRVTELILDKPVINLEADAAGKGNWSFATVKPPADQVSANEAGASIKQLSLGDVRINEGTISYRDLKAGTVQTFQNVNATVSLPSLDEPLNVEGDLAWNGETLDINSMVKRPRAFMDSGKTQVTLALRSRVVTMTFDGAMTVKSGAINGHLNMSADSARKLAAWAGSPLPEGEGFGPLKVKGVFAVAGNDISFRDAAVSLDNMNGNGDIAVNTAGRVPAIKGAIALDRLDVNPYMGAAGSAQAKPAAAPVGPGAGWSDAPINVAGLKAINADLNLTVGEFLVQRIKMGKSALALKLNNGLLSADLRELALYEGAGKGTFVLDGTKAAPTIKTSLSFDAIKALPLLTDAAEMDWLEGVGTMTLDITGSGRSQAAIMRSLNGKGSLKFIDGAIKGVNLAAIARSLQNVVTGAALGGNLYGESAKTDFAEFGGTFTIANGVLANEDLKLLNPLVRMTGKGIVDVGQRTMKYRVEPRAVGTIEGQGGAADTAGIGVPFLVSGPWTNLSFQPDLQGVLEGSIRDVLSGKGVQIPGLGGQGENGEEVKPEDLLQGILGGKKKPQNGSQQQQPQNNSGTLIPQIFEGLAGKKAQPVVEEPAAEEEVLPPESEEAPLPEEESPAPEEEAAPPPSQP